MKVTLILACAGCGKRANLGYNKIFFNFNEKMHDNCCQYVFMKSLNAFIESKLIDDYIIVASKNEIETIKKIVPPFVNVIEGGTTRTDSVKNALKMVNDGIVLIHDGARPFVLKSSIQSCIESVIKNGSGICAINSPDTIALVENEKVCSYIGKSNCYLVQTPQGFYAKDIKTAYNFAENKTFNDDGEVYKNYFGKLFYCKGSINNKKLTFEEDFLNNNISNLKAGVGFDCHKLVNDRKLILGGIVIPFDKGLEGHSDADVLVHAIMDAILSAAALRDIGFYFPDNDDKYLNACSIDLLKIVIEKIEKNGFKIKNLSASLLCEKPKLCTYIDKIKENLAKTIKISPSNIGITATTLEGLGFVGREEGICCQAFAILEEI